MPATAKVIWYPEELQAWTPPERLRISEWTERCRVLTEPAEEKGPLRLRRTPYLIPVLDVFQEPSVEVVVLCKPAQIAGTEAMLSILGYYAHQEQASIMLILADEDTAVYMSRERIHRMFQNSPEMERLIIPEALCKTEITLANGAYIALGWASSVAKLASRPIRIMIFDEIDKPGYYVSTREAGPISLEFERTETFYNRKIALLSTPTIESGNIWQYLNACDVIFDWHVPCPHCGQYQPLRWSLKQSSGCTDGRYRDRDGAMRPIGQVKWEGGRNATAGQIAAAGYECGPCGRLWTSEQKDIAVTAGLPVPRTDPPDRPRKVGFHVNRLYSLLGRSGNIPKLVADWIDCVKSGDPKRMQGFVNSTLAEPWQERIVAKAEAEILKACCQLPEQLVPQEAMALTCFVDVQKYGKWFAVRAWAKDYTSWLIHYGYLGTWEEVEDLLFATAYPVDAPDREPLRIWRAGIDTGGGEAEDGPSMTEETYTWLRANRRGRGCPVWGTKGASKPISGKIWLGRPLDKMPSGKPIPGGLQIVLLDTEKLKDAYHYRLGLAIEGQSQGAYLHRDIGATYLSHITAEEKQRDRRGQEHWVRVRARNDLLDCEIGNFALADPEWPGGGVHLLGGRGPATAPPSGGLPNAEEQKRQAGKVADWFKNPRNQSGWFGGGRR